ncbi:hypothetical protein CGZ69_15310 [Streptomyces peucetius subsp. caesius ATCC 27952]|nr:hypothetical protein CGZ69_15310 [Streptomyces peucetius subsp. caesius ATCC 27952]
MRDCWRSSVTKKTLRGGGSRPYPPAGSGRMGAGTQPRRARCGGGRGAVAGAGADPVEPTASAARVQARAVRAHRATADAALGPPLSSSVDEHGALAEVNERQDRRLVRGWRRPR